MAALYLSEADVRQVLDMRSAVDAVEEVFRRLADGQAANVPRQRAIAEGIVLHSLSAAAPYLNLVGWKCYTTTRSAARFLLGLYDSASGEPVALVEADWLGQVRTGATSAVAAEWMADPRATELGLFGAGRQARTQLEALATVRRLRAAYVYSRNADRREAFCDEMSQRLGFDVRPVDRPQEAVEDLPIVVTATAAREPVFDGHDLAEGAWVCAVGSNWPTRAELDYVTVRRADNIVCDSTAACQQEAGDFADALARGDFSWATAVDLADVAAGRAVARSTARSITLFKSVGLAIEDLAVGAVVLRRAREHGLGSRLPF